MGGQIVDATLVAAPMGLFIRTIGLKGAKAKIALANLGTSIYRSPNSLRDDSLSPGSGSERCGNRGFSGYRTT